MRTMNGSGLGEVVGRPEVECGRGVNNIFKSLCGSQRNSAWLRRGCDEPR